MAEIQSLKKLNSLELQDLLKNIGVLQEANRTFFNPIGLKLVLNEKLNLELHRSKDLQGVVLHTIDPFRMKAFIQFRNEKHKQRQETLGEIIQTQGLIRKDKLAEEKDLKLSSPQNLKLNKLLRCVDNVAYNVKKRLMEVSKDKDKKLDIPFNKVFRGIEFDLAHGKYTDAISKMIIIESKDDIEKEIDRIKKIKEKQDRIFNKGNKKYE